MAGVSQSWDEEKKEDGYGCRDEDEGPATAKPTGGAVAPATDEWLDDSPLHRPGVSEIANDERVAG
jgi:hypothetical protein